MSRLPPTVLALGAILLWSLLAMLAVRLASRRVAPFPTAAVGLFCMLSGALSLACHRLLEAPYVPTSRELAWIAALALGPMGAAFFLWDAAMKRGDPRTLGTLAYLTPLGSTLWLIATGAGTLTATTAAAALFIVGGAALGALRA